MDRMSALSSELISICGWDAADPVLVLRLPQILGTHSPNPGVTGEMEHTKVLKIGQ